MPVLEGSAAQLFLRYLEFEVDRLAAVRAGLKATDDIRDHAFECKLQALTVLEIRDGFRELWEGGPTAFDSWATQTRYDWRPANPPPAPAGPPRVVDVKSEPSYQAACAREDEFRAAVERARQRRAGTT